MDSVLSNFDIDNVKNFWKLYPSWKTPKVYNDLYKNDKSKGKTKSSNLMWAVVHMFDKSEANPYRNMDSQDRLDVINEDILEMPDFKWENYKEIVEFTKMLFYSEEERNLYTFLEFVEIRRKFIEDAMQNMSLGNLKELDDAVKRNAVNMNEIERLRNVVEQKADEGKTKGDIIESWLERQ